MNGAPQMLGAPLPTSDLLTSNSSGLRIVTTAPLNDDVVSTPLGQLVVGFDRELDANLVNASTVGLERLDTHAEVPLRMVVPIVAPSTLLINPQEPLTAGSYRLVLRGTGGGALAGLNAIPLNSSGDFSGGSDVSLEFRVSVKQ